MSDDYYELLGVDPDAAEEAIRRAYRARVAEHHPDVSDADDAEETFRRLNRAKEVLTDEDRRREYDSLGHERYLERRRDGERTPEDATGRTDGTADVAGGADPRPDGVSSGRTRGWLPWLYPHGSVDEGGLFGSHGGLDLRAFLRSNGPRTDRQTGSREAPSAADEAVECPNCLGRGRFVHELDTGLGRRRRIEPCEQCGGAGTIPR